MKIRFTLALGTMLLAATTVDAQYPYGPSAGPLLTPMASNSNVGQLGPVQYGAVAPPSPYTTPKPTPRRQQYIFRKTPAPVPQTAPNRAPTARMQPVSTQRVANRQAPPYANRSQPARYASQRNVTPASQVQAGQLPAPSYGVGAGMAPAAVSGGPAMSASQLPGWGDDVPVPVGSDMAAAGGPVGGPGPMGGPGPVDGPIDDGSAGGGPVGDGGGYAGAAYGGPGNGGGCESGQCGGGGHHCCLHECGIFSPPAPYHRCCGRSTGNMPPHFPYFPHAHGYYYFKPYNAIHVLQQQEMAAKWGLDPRNPYDNRFFERIYQQQEEAQERAAVTSQEPVSTPETVTLPPGMFPR